MHHHGNYTCVAEDSGNHSDRRSVYVHVKSQGTSLVLLHVTSSAVTVTWRGLHSSREYRVRYRESGRDLQATTPSVGVIVVKPYMRSFTASHLSAETKYTFCIDVRQETFAGRFHTARRGQFVTVDCAEVITRHRRYAQPLVRRLTVHVLIGAAAGLASLGLLVTLSTLVTRRYDRRKLRQAALQSVSVSSGGILLQRDDEPTATGTGSAATSAAAAASVTFENRAALEGMCADSDDCDVVAMFDWDDLDEIRTTATMMNL